MDEELISAQESLSKQMKEVLTNLNKSEIKNEQKFDILSRTITTLIDQNTSQLKLREASSDVTEIMQQEIDALKAIVNILSEDFKRRAMSNE